MHFPLTTFAYKWQTSISKARGSAESLLTWGSTHFDGVKLYVNPRGDHSGTQSGKIRESVSLHITYNIINGLLMSNDNENKSFRLLKLNNFQSAYEVIIESWKWLNIVVGSVQTSISIRRPISSWSSSLCCSLIQRQYTKRRRFSIRASVYSNITAAHSDILGS